MIFPAVALAQAVNIDLGTGAGLTERVVQLVGLLTVLSLAPSIVIMTTLGGSEVRAYCASPSESRTTAGASEACGAYTCNTTSGLCRDRCASSNDCDSSARCDIPSGTCVAVPRG